MPGQTERSLLLSWLRERILRHADLRNDSEKLDNAPILGLGAEAIRSPDREPPRLPHRELLENPLAPAARAEGALLALQTEQPKWP